MIGCFIAILFRLHKTVEVGITAQLEELAENVSFFLKFDYYANMLSITIYFYGLICEI